MKRVGVDIGGTFTDCLLSWDGEQVLAKSLTTHHNLSLGFMSALESACGRLGVSVEEVLTDIESVRYATTLGTNALIARTGPTVGLITTAGFDSTVPLSRGRGYGEGLDLRQQGDLPAAKRPEPLVPIQLIASVRERIDYHGRVVTALDEAGLSGAVRKLVDRGAQAIVVSFVNSVVNPVHELRAEEVILEEYPSHNLGSIPIVLSHQVTGRKGEYVRTMSGVLDAYLHNEMYHGLTSLQTALRERGHRRPLLVIHCTGGTAQLNSTHALQTIHSGPVSGVSASELLADQYELGNVVATDMGGTSFDIAIVTGGGIKWYDFNPVIDRWLVTIPMIHLVTLGAGGGSIASYDRLFSSIEVGPASAGSDPGPASYDRGGRHATVTDADLILGYLNPETYAGGSLKLSVKRAEQAMLDLADEMGLEDSDDCNLKVAHLIKKKTDGNMANGIFKELGVRGYDVRKFTILAYGGNGPLHCCGIANELNVNKILVPPLASVFSALGVANMQQLHIHEMSTHIDLYDSVTHAVLKDFTELNTTVEELETRGRDDLTRQGLPAEAVKHRLEFDMRYGNQMATTSVVSPVLRFKDTSDVLGLIAAFARDYGARFGKGAESPEAGIRIQTVRVASYIEGAPLELPKLTSERRPAAQPASSRQCYFDGSLQSVTTDVYTINDLSPGEVVTGPAVIEAATTTYLVEPGWRLVMVGEEGAAWFERIETREGALQ
jgi:N-methylhydantoinase A